MNKVNNKILDMIRSQKSVNEIMNVCNLDNVSVCLKINRLKEKGYLR